MARAYYGTRISENMTRTPEGFLICHNVPICRTGWQTYTGHELGLDSDDPVEVYRSEDEVTNPLTIASFEGKTVTDGHPSQYPITPDTESTYHRGHVQNVRKGTELVDGEVPLLADLFIKDTILINKIDGGMREVSCGYDCKWPSTDKKGGPNGYEAFAQTDIRGNHIAVVPEGRAGDRVAIRDELPEKLHIRRTAMDGKELLKHIFGLGFIAWAKDAKPEEAAKVAEAMKEEKKEEPAEDCHCKDCAAKDAEIAELKKKAEKKEEPAGEDAIDALEEELSNKGKEKKEEKAVDELTGEVPTLSGEELPENPIPGADSAMALQMVRKMKPIIAGIKDTAQRKAATDAFVSSIRDLMVKPPVSQKTGGYGDMLKTRKATDANAQTQAARDEAYGESLRKYHRKSPALVAKGGK